MRKTLNKIKLLGAGFGLSIMLSACDSNNDDYANNEDTSLEVSEETDIQELERILEKNDYEQFLAKLQTINKSKIGISKIEKFEDLGSEFAGRLLEEKEFDFIDLNYDNILNTGFIIGEERTIIRDYRKNQIEIVLDDMEKNIRDNSFEVAVQLYNENIYIHDHADSHALYSYVLFLRGQNNTTHKLKKLQESISPNYSGRMSKEIKDTIVTSAGSYDNWKLVYYENKRTKSIKKSNISIGMTDDEVLKSEWGEPNKINKTESAYGIREQWVYDRGYLYFEDGYLTTIQTSQ